MSKINKKDREALIRAKMKVCRKNITTEWGFEHIVVGAIYGYDLKEGVLCIITPKHDMWGITDIFVEKRVMTELEAERFIMSDIALNDL